MTMQNNSFLHPIDELHFGTYKTEDVQPALEHAEKLAWERLDAVEQIPAEERTFANTVLDFMRATDEFDAIISIVDTHEGQLGGEWNEAYEKAAKRASKLRSKINVHEGLFGALQEYADQHQEELQPNFKKLIKEIIRDYKRSGIALPKDKKEHLTSLRLELSETTTKFAQNVVKANDEAALHVTDAAELAGLSESFIAAAKKAAQDKALDGYLIAYNEPNYVKVMSQCSVQATRKTFHEIANTRAADVNPPLADKILALRSEIASMLGYKNYADYALENRMIKNGHIAKAFIADLADRYRPKAQDEHASLVAFAKKFDNNPALELTISDIDSGLNFYYAAKQAETVSGVNEEDLKAFFPIDNVIKGMFETLTTLYGVTFTPSGASVWHDDVTTYDLHNEAGQHIARVWCDWFTRPGKKGGAWMNSYYAAERTGKASDKPHLGYVSANFDRPTDDKPSLLSLRDVETAWHEFGHFMHFALGNTELPEQSMNGCLWDFIEAPSQIMENWVWQPEIMKSMARHHATGEELADETIASLIAARTFRVASSAMRQLYFATVDLGMHTDLGTDSALEFSRKIKANFVPIPVAPYEASIASFTHVFAGGYAAAYYSYKWAEAIEADLFSRFKTEGVLNPSTGHAYAAEILSRGDEEEPSVLIENFLGRQATSDAMLQRDGIVQ